MITLSGSNSRSASKPARGWTYSTCVALTAVLLSGSVLGQTIMPPGHQAVMFARIIAYDRALTKRAGGNTVTIGVLYKKSDEMSMNVALGTLEALKKLQGRTVHKLRLNAIDLSYRDDETLAKALSNGSVHVLYVAPGFGQQLNRIKALCVAHKIIPISPVKEYVEGGLAAGVYLEGTKPKILLNLRVMKSYGMDLDPQVIAVSEITK